MFVRLRRHMVRLRARLGRPGFPAGGRRGQALSEAAVLIAALAVSALSVRLLDARLRPALEAAAQSRAVNLMTRTIHAAVDDCLSQNGMDYEDFISTRTDGQGRITALNGSTAAGSRFRRQVTEAVMAELEDLDREKLRIPLGALTGWPPLAGLGPTVRVSVYALGDVTAEYDSSFTGAGVNQTLHQVRLNVSATVYLFLPGEILPVTASSCVPVAETVIIGETPDTFLNFTTGGSEYER